MSTKDNKPTKIVFFHIMRENFSGAQKNIYRLLIHLNTKTVLPVLVGQNKAPLTELASKKGIDTRIVPFPKELEVFDGQILKFNVVTLCRFIRGIWKYNKTLIEECKKIKPEAIWCDNIRTFITLYITGRSIKAKMIWNVWSEPKGRVAWVAHRIGLLLADRINLEYSAQGEKIFGALVERSLFKNKIVPLYTGVSDFEEISGGDIRKELSLRLDSTLIIMASNIVPGKGQLDLIRSMEQVAVKSDHVHLLIAGTPVDSSPSSMRYHQEIKDYVKSNQLGKCVHFIGWRSDIRDVLEASNIYVSTSYTESFPDAVREAMLASLPVIVTDVGGTSELVDVGENGYLFKPGDLQALTYYIRMLINNADLRETMGSKSKTIIDTRFSTEVYARNFEYMLRDLVHK
jgi:glycosyltransferase involved in cell wall biosynthesis